MSSSRTLLAIGLLAAIASAQVSTCHGFNHQANTAQALAVPQGSSIAASYALTSAMAVTQMQFYFTGGNASALSVPQGTIQIVTADAAGLPSTNVVAVGPIVTVVPGQPIQIGPGWRGPTFGTPVILNGGSAYWVVVGATGNLNVGVQAGGPDAVTSSTLPAGATPWSPPTLANPLKMRLRSTNCNGVPGSGFGWVSVGTGCAGIALTPPLLQGTTAPSLGSIATISIGNAQLGAPAALFWSLGTTTGGGAPLGAGCTLWLDLASFAQFSSLGLNPIALVTIDGLGNASFTLPIPADPNLVGFGFGFQAGIADLGAPPFVVTQAILATIGW